MVGGKCPFRKILTTGLIALWARVTHSKLFTKNYSYVKMWKLAEKCLFICLRKVIAKTLSKVPSATKHFLSYTMRRVCQPNNGFIILYFVFKITRSAIFALNYLWERSWEIGIGKYFCFSGKLWTKCTCRRVAESSHTHTLYISKYIHSHTSKHTHRHNHTHIRCVLMIVKAHLGQLYACATVHARREMRRCVCEGVCIARCVCVCVCVCVWVCVHT